MEPFGHGSMDRVACQWSVPQGCCEQGCCQRQRLGMSVLQYLFVVVLPAAQPLRDEQLVQRISQATGACWAVGGSELMLAGACLLSPAQHEGQLLLGEWEP